MPVPTCNAVSSCQPVWSGRLGLGSDKTGYYVNTDLSGNMVLSSQPRVTVTSRFVYEVIRDLESIDYLCINPAL